MADFTQDDISKWAQGRSGGQEEASESPTGADINQEPGGGAPAEETPSAKLTTYTGTLESLVKDIQAVLETCDDDTKDDGADLVDTLTEAVDELKSLAEDAEPAEPEEGEEEESTEPDGDEEPGAGSGFSGA